MPRLPLHLLRRSESGSDEEVAPAAVDLAPAAQYSGAGAIEGAYSSSCTVSLLPVHL